MTTNNLNLNPGNECVLCSESINQPICHECLAKQVKTWLNYYPDIKKKISPKINSFVKDLSNGANSNQLPASLLTNAVVSLVISCQHRSNFPQSRRNIIPHPT
jgi:hypothetical protein